MLMLWYIHNLLPAVKAKGVEYPLVLVIYNSTLHFLPCNITHQSVPVKVQ